METLWTFKTARFTVQLQCEEEQEPDVSWADAETLEKLESGEYQNVTFFVRVLLDGIEFGSDSLGNSVYADVREFQRERIGLKAKSRADGCSYGDYFTDMVRSAVSEARTVLQGFKSIKVREA